MAELYFWKTPETYPDQLIGRYERERSPDRFLLLKGIKLPAKLIEKYHKQHLMFVKKKPTIQDAKGKKRGFYLYRYENDVYVLVVHNESDSEVLNLSYLIQTKNDNNAEKELSSLVWPKVENDQKASANVGHVLQDFIISNYKQTQHPAKLIAKFSVPKQKLLKYDCLQSSANIPLINRRITEILVELAPNDVQFFDTKIECNDGELEGYKYLNVTHEIDGIDFEHSIFGDGKIKDKNLLDLSVVNFRYVTYKIGCMGKYKLARDADFHGHLLVTKEIKDVFESEKISGVRFVRPEDYYPVF